ncbi:MAG TPA: YhjD/YihY/BrkB family envelope integrity protein [Candidatus Binataceae bacterium]|nr:YhjD/YihY/BrkB family envelope integrity protein [Candidatus Binataceae bacterium]
MISDLPGVLNYGRRPRMVAEAAVGRFIDNDDLLWASALTYTSALSIVPLLVLVFSVLKGLGYTDQLEPVITRYVGSPDIANQLLTFVHNMKVAALGSVGAVTLIVTDISLLGTIENALNHSWGVAKGRSYFRKFTDYLSITFVVPVLLVTALTLTAGVTKSEAFLKGISFIASFGLVWAGYFVLFVFFPNTKVKWRPALIGALITAVLWTVAQWAYIHFQYGVTSYKAYYGALAAIPVFLVWIYFSWAIVLLGVEFAVVLQRGPYRPMKSAIGPDFVRRAVILTLMRIGRRMMGHGEPVTAGSIAYELGVAEDTIAPVIARLEQAGLLVDAEVSAGIKDSGELLLTRTPGQILLSGALEFAGPKDHLLDCEVEQSISRIEALGKKALGDITVLDLIDDVAEPHERANRGAQINSST